MLYCYNLDKPLQFLQINSNHFRLSWWGFIKTNNRISFIQVQIKCVQKFFRKSFFINKDKPKKAYWFGLDEPNNKTIVV